MMSSKTFVAFMSLLLVVAVSLATGQISTPYEARLGERALARIAGRSDTSAYNGSACGSASLDQGQVLWNNCAGNDGKGCVKCLTDSWTKIDNTSGGPGIQKAGGLAVCKNRDKSVGTCNAGTCENPMKVGKCADVSPQTYGEQPN